MSALLSELGSLYKKIVSSYESKNYDAGLSTLESLKLSYFRALINEETAQALPETVSDQYRQALEMGVLLYVGKEDKEGFLRQMNELKGYYFDTDLASHKNSEYKYTLLGLYLVYLLMENQLSDFHSELERFTAQERSKNPCLLFAIEIEQSLMVGSYDRVLSSSNSIPHPCYKYFVSNLVETVRSLVADCNEVAYQCLPIDVALKYLLLESRQKLDQYIQENRPTWSIQNGYIFFSKTEDKTLKAIDIPAEKVMGDTLSYATELERIV